METVNTLNDLLSRNYDAEKGFDSAAENAKSSVLKDYFKKNSKMHYKFGHDLKEDITRLGGDVKKGSSIEGSAHRAWLNVKSAVAGNTDEALIEECKRGQKTAMEDYQEAVGKITDPKINSKLSKHKSEITEVVAELNGLELNS